MYISWERGAEVFDEFLVDWLAETKARVEWSDSV